MRRSLGRPQLFLFPAMLLSLVALHPAQASDRERFAAATPGASVRQEGDAPRWIAAAAGDALSSPTDGSAEDAARAFLHDRRDLLGLNERDVAGLELTSRVRGAGGSTHLYFRQTLGGLEVRGGRVNATVRADGAVLFVGSRLFPGLTPPEPSRIVPAENAADRSSPPRLVLVPRNGVARLAWEVRGSDEIVLVDAEDGAVLDRASLVFHASARVLNATKPDPESEEWAPAEYQLLGLPASTPGSPQGWLGGDGTNLSGNNASSHLFDLADPGPSSPTGVYDYPFNTPQSALVNAWYVVNDAHDRFYALGFDEQAGNFQQDNFGQGGIGGDAVRVLEVAGGQRQVPIASFTATVDGEAPTLTFAWKIGCRHCADHDGDPSNGGDRALGFMREIIVHEYAHGVATRRVGGPADDTCLLGFQSRRVAEDWSDILAASFFDEPRKGEYFHEGGGWLRDPRHDRIYGPAPDWVWAGALWDLRRSMIALDPATGRADFERLVVEAMALTPCGPTLLDGRDALLAADTLLFASAHHGPIWNGFAARGMGQGASSMGQDDQSPVVDFTVPAAFACATPAAPGGLSAIASGSGTVGLTYTATGATAVEVWRDDLDNPADAAARITVTNNTATFTDSTVQGGKSYRYHLVALGSAGVTCPSDASATADVVATGSCDAVYPIFVPDLTVTDTGDPGCAVTLSWQPAQPACPGSSAPIVYNVYRSLEASPIEGLDESTGMNTWGGDAGTPGFEPSDLLLVARTTGTEIADVPPGKDLSATTIGGGGEQFFFDSAAYYLVLAQHGTLLDPPDHRDRGSSQVMQWAPAIPTYGRTTVASWDFESGPQGWTVNNISGVPPEHDWRLVVPSPSYWGETLLAPDEAAGGSGHAWVTGDGGGGPSTAVSHGCEDLTFLTSPVFGLPWGTLLSFDYWAHGQASGELYTGLGIRVNIPTDVSTWDMGMLTTQRFLGPGRYGWQRGEIDLRRLWVSVPTTMWVDFFGFRCGDTDEFGIDNVRLDRATVCPRSNLKLECVLIDDSSTALGDGDGQLEPGETARVAVRLRNDGAATAATPSGFLQPRSIGAAVLDGHATFPNIASGVTHTSLGDGFLVSSPSSAGPLGSTTWELQITDSTGEMAKVLWSVPNDGSAVLCGCVDSDEDGIGDLCDNCPNQVNANQADDDADGAGTVCDCAPDDPTASVVPVSVTGVGFPGLSKSLLTWDPGPATQYEVHVGSIDPGDPFSYVHACQDDLSTSAPQTDDTEVPPSGGLRYYLILGSNVCGDTGVGSDSASNPRPYTSCTGEQ